MRHRDLWSIVLALTLFCAVGACNDETATGNGDSDEDAVGDVVDDGGDTSEPVDAVDGGEDTAEDTGGEDTAVDTGNDVTDTTGDATDVDGGNGDGCNYNGSSNGVCGDATRNTDGVCKQPADYEGEEVSCDGKDNDCDGTVDEGCLCDYDGNSTGVCAQGTKSEDGTCQEPADYEMDESLCDAKDNDCDGEVDEGCTCTDGDTESCYTGPSGTAGTGECEAGTRTCQSDQTWGSCMNETTPSTETCDDADNDCDGTVDEGCSCDFDGESEGVCSNGTIGPNGDCTAPGDYEDDEVSCDGKDNDCDGTVDEGCFCDYNGTSTGVCSDGTISDDGTCEEPADYESDETSCDAKDNDCDGTVDENCMCDPGETESCYSGPSGTAGTGVCTEGTRECQSDSTWGDCQGETTPSNETCDGKDNDCDGTVDEGCSCNYEGKDAGVCQNQTIQEDGTCPEPENYEETEETCGDGLDNDCDGDTDCGDGDCTAVQCNGDGTECQSGDGVCHEIACTDGVDNDGDNGADECDPNDCPNESCGTGARCIAGGCTETDCTDGNDNDGDGDVDCADEDCNRRSCGQNQLCCFATGDCRAPQECTN